jgi:hypothetical protein
MLLLIASPSLVLALTASPGAVVQGNSPYLTISTPNAQWSTGVTVDLGAGITTGPIQVVSSERLLVQAVVSADAAIGPRDIVVQQGGNQVVGTGALLVLAPQNGIRDINVMTNPGFETGDMTDWTTTTWSVVTTQPHSGTYDAHDAGGSGGGGLCLEQDFSTPIDSNTITAFTFWLRQLDDAGIAQVGVHYQNGHVEYGVAFPNADDSWTFENFTALVLPNQFVTGIHICGFGGGYSTPDDSWADDFSLDTQEGTPVQHVTWGHLKILMH